MIPGFPFKHHINDLLLTSSQSLSHLSREKAYESTLTLLEWQTSFLRSLQVQTMTAGQYSLLAFDVHQLSLQTILQMEIMEDEILNT